MRGITLHGLSVIDAAQTGLAYMEQVYPDEMKRTSEYRKIARVIGVPLVEDERLAAARHQRAMRTVFAEFGVNEADLGVPDDDDGAG